MELIGQGMEGAVYDLGDGRVRKIWFDRRPDDVRPLKEFLDELPALPFRTPRIREIAAGADGQAVHDEHLLTGTALNESGLTESEALDAFVAVVEALGPTTPGPASKALPVLNQPFWRDDLSWGEALAALVRRRAAESHRHLRRDVTDFDELLEDLTTRLATVEPGRLSVVHGDICQPNLLMDGPRTAAVIDWGFYSTAGDNTFDAALAAGFFDMYGPDAQRLDNLLLDRFEALGHDRRRMYLYRAAYAITTATIYDADAGDGHYRWCVGNLNRLPS
ncbi:aminoglycoside phosphotransferase family protein [Kribbella turkmenica]|uniref:Aminoglycoside phosphotransferase family protein n=1 Tax=Kribbella turkmenica TaxID=2530375 RepID=A0A4R4WQ68_9ACTN|nr:phosphotransferase [Kribbella turkmenica]TDD16730.1 aminoglycoside phosphotransferase family protein [Kribbella turkmenica]